MNQGEGRKKGREKGIKGIIPLILPSLPWFLLSFLPSLNKKESREGRSLSFRPSFPLIERNQGERKNEGIKGRKEWIKRKEGKKESNEWFPWFLPSFFPSPWFIPSFLWFLPSFNKKESTFMLVFKGHPYQMIYIPLQLKTSLWFSGAVLDVSSRLSGSRSSLRRSVSSPRCQRHAKRIQTSCFRHLDVLLMRIWSICKYHRMARRDIVCVSYNDLCRPK